MEGVCGPATTAFATRGGCARGGDGYGMSGGVLEAVSRRSRRMFCAAFDISVRSVVRHA